MTNGAITWRGDEIIGISPNSDFLPFYPDAFSERKINKKVTA